ncbi:MAG: hypothetical protein MRJ93_13965 [Nitrososphaeraceae archaeon]|nr:hypothetical protein [Nitrososphaeraceae archaeon]
MSFFLSRVLWIFNSSRRILAQFADSNIIGPPVKKFPLLCTCLYATCIPHKNNVGMVS